MSVYLGRADVAMSEKLLNNADIYAIFEEMGGITVSEGMYRSLFFDSCLLKSRFHNLLHTSLRISSSTLSLKYILLRTIFLIIIAKKWEKFFRKWNIAIFFSFGLTDFQSHPLRVYIGYFEIHTFGKSESSCIYQSEYCFVFEIFCGIKEFFDFSFWEDIWKFSLSFFWIEPIPVDIFFFEKSEKEELECPCELLMCGLWHSISYLCSKIIFYIISRKVRDTFSDIWEKNLQNS